MAGGSRSKTKGSAFERDLAKILGDALGGKFIRTANSGAFVGGLNAGRKAGLSRAQISGQKGDLIPPDHLGHLVIEAKAYRDFRFHQLLTQEPMPQLETWIEQALDAVDPGDVWLIAFKVDRRGIYIFMPDRLEEPKYTWGNHARYVGARATGFISDLSSFLRHNAETLCCASADPGAL